MATTENTQQSYSERVLRAYARAYNVSEAQIIKDAQELQQECVPGTSFDEACSLLASMLMGDSIPAKVRKQLKAQR